MNNSLNQIRRDLLMRAAAFVLLKDSKASYAIEGESPPQTRIWMEKRRYSCVEQTIDEIIPSEVDYLLKYDEFKYRTEQKYDMPDKMIALLVRFLEQGDGKLSKRAKEKEFEMLTEQEVEDVEGLYQEIFQT